MMGWTFCRALWERSIRTTSTQLVPPGMIPNTALDGQADSHAKPEPRSEPRPDRHSPIKVPPQKIKFQASLLEYFRATNCCLSTHTHSRLPLAQFKVANLMTEGLSKVPPFSLRLSVWPSEGGGGGD